jgi:hypothetical protein
MNNNKSVFDTLSGVSVKDKIERKGNLDYLSWCNAWSLLKQAYPEAQRRVYEHDHTGFNYFTDGRTCWVKVGITVNGMEHVDYLPIMDYRNNAIPVDKVTATDVNKAIQRSTAKAIAMHGLGLSLWTGEDVPEAVTEPKAETARIPLMKNSPNWENVAKYVEANKGMGIDAICTQLKRKYVITPAIMKELNSIVSPPKKPTNGNTATAQG